jgi:hypothetical protein
LFLTRNMGVQVNAMAPGMRYTSLSTPSGSSTEAKSS